jgi:hypothetical protein
VGRRSQTERKKKPAHSGRDDRLAGLAQNRLVLRSQTERKKKPAHSGRDDRLAGLA